jgi:hypothetical protein
MIETTEAGVVLLSVVALIIWASQDSWLLRARR